MKLTKHILEAIQRGINLAIDDFDDMDIDAQKVGQIKHSMNTRELIKYSHFADLGLPSGTLWAKYNVGVNPHMLNSAQDWYGNYYAWGETEEKHNYNWKTYKYANNDCDELTKYCNDADFCNDTYKPDNLITLQDEDDVATQTNKLHWTVKMPTKEQFDELLKYTTNEYVTDYQRINGLNGQVFTSMQNGNEIFIPAAGFRANSTVYNVGLTCNLWSRSLFQNRPYCSYFLSGYSLNCALRIDSRYLGFSIRSVLTK